ncbi:MAG: Gfo/Idh/MocA family oxidoreductase [Candidatus Eremiobacteraeota bacterium]|nr:Gfo/Idh/MocA family oxidoreductase [Candidatus Eremiobacteraeota bacterium]
MKPINIGIIGTGIAARDLHWPALKQIKGRMKIVAVCNHTEPKAKKYAKMVGGVPYVLDYRDLLSMPDVEAVDIVLPIELNYRVTLDALEAGKHVIVEKPMAVNLEEAKKMLEFPAGFPQVMMVAEHFRYMPKLIRAREMIEEGEIGNPYAVVWTDYHRMHLGNKYAKTKWRLEHKYRGGFITDAGIHNIAGLRFLFGDFDVGSAFAQRINPDLGEMDTFSLQFRMKNGIQGSLILYYSAIEFNEDRLIIFGDGGTIIAGGGKIALQRSGKPIHIEKLPGDPGYRGEFENFYEAIREGKNVVATFEESYRDLEVMMNAIDSTQSGHTVKL